MGLCIHFSRAKTVLLFSLWYLFSARPFPPPKNLNYPPWNKWNHSWKTAYWTDLKLPDKSYTTHIFLNILLLPCFPSFCSNTSLFGTRGYIIHSAEDCHCPRGVAVDFSILLGIHRLWGWSLAPWPAVWVKADFLTSLRLTFNMALWTNGYEG